MVVQRYLITIRWQMIKMALASFDGTNFDILLRLPSQIAVLVVQVGIIIHI